ncbi:MAG: peptidoglycan DD-metalloendopeptidase family protein, partial [Clostridia bacterium]|nr:peptidoglycan DD-metalloendopeptidase family protein [Clostridia bacterium]
KWLIIDHDDGTYSSYQNLSSVNATQKQWINKGDLIGYCGSSGNAQSVQLHFEVRIGAKNSIDNFASMQTINPNYIDFNYSKDIIHSVTHIFDNNNTIFTVITDTDKIDKVKVAIASNPTTELSVSDTYSVNEDGNYVWTLSAPMPTEKTEYSFDVRDSVNTSYLKRYFNYTVDPSVSSSILSASHKYDDGKLIFTVTTKTGDYDRIKLSFADKLSESLAVSSSYAKTPTGDFLWTIEYETDSPLNSYAFDLRSSTEAKYFKDYFKYDVTTYEIVPEIPPVEIWRITGNELRLRTSPSTSGSIITIVPNGIYVTVTETQSAEGYNWGKVSFGDYSGWCALEYAEKVTLPSNFYTDWYWPVPTSSPEIFTNGSWLLTEYTKSNNGIDITNVSSKTPVYAAKSGYLYHYNYETAIIDHANNAYSSYGKLSEIVVAGGSYVQKGQLIGYASTKVHFEIRAGFKSSSNYSSMVSFDPQIFTYTYDSQLIKSVKATPSGSKLVFTIVTKAGDFNRVKVADSNDLSSYIKYTDSYEVDSNGDFVWTINAPMPTADTKYAVDIRVGSTSKYLKLYAYYDY